jgi:iron complex transport system ATP-binding protein
VPDREIALSVAGLTVRYSATTALRDVSFDLPAGLAAAVVGPNGSGKTTLLRSLAGLVSPTSGEVRWRERPRIAFVLQHGADQQWLPLTAAEVIRMGRFAELGALRPLRRADRTAVSTAAERMEVADLLRAQFSDLSGGQRQRVLLAQALVQEPDVLLLDEPITGLDLASQQRILDVINEETDAGRTVVLSTHHLEEAKRCDMVVLVATELVAMGPAEEVLTAPNLRQAYGARVLSVDSAADGQITLLDDHGHGHGHDHDHDQP